VITAEGFESTQDINPQQIQHITDHFLSRGGLLHGIKLKIPLTAQTFRGGNVTDLPVTLMIGRETGDIYTTTSPNGLLEAVQQVAAGINDAHEAAPMSYQVEYAGQPVKGKKPAAPVVRVNREGVELKVISVP
jgi:hypothetical protein